MNKEKQFDCVKFKNELHENLLKKSGVKNIREYVEYVNKAVKTSALNKKNQINCKSTNGT